jgi:hypothetical protein
VIFISVQHNIERKLNIVLRVKLFVAAVNRRYVPLQRPLVVGSEFVAQVTLKTSLLLDDVIGVTRRQMPIENALVRERAVATIAQKVFLSQMNVSYVTHQNRVVWKPLTAICTQMISLFEMHTFDVSVNVMSIFRLKITLLAAVNFCRVVILVDVNRQKPFCKKRLAAFCARKVALFGVQGFDVPPEGRLELWLELAVLTLVHDLDLRFGHERLVGVVLVGVRHQFGDRVEFDFANFADKLLQVVGPVFHLKNYE